MVCGGGGLLFGVLSSSNWCLLLHVAGVLLLLRCTVLRHVSPWQQQSHQQQQHAAAANSSTARSWVSRQQVRREG